MRKNRWRRSLTGRASRLVSKQQLLGYLQCLSRLVLSVVTTVKGKVASCDLRAYMSGSNRADILEAKKHRGGHLQNVYADMFVCHVSGAVNQIIKRICKFVLIFEAEELELSYEINESDSKERGR